MRIFTRGRRTLYAVLLLLVALPHGASAQDTLRVMQYNLLQYGGTISGCTPDAPSTKNTFLTTIAGAVKPDIFGCNELGSSTLYMENVYQNVLLPLDANYERTTYSNNASSSVTNGMFYRGDKLGLVEERVINHSLRDLNLYTFYYKDPGLGSGADTTFLTFVVVHMKAGSNSSDENTRLDQANVIMNYLNGQGYSGNIFIMGDFNLKSSTEASYQAFLTHTNMDIRMYDPINTPGGWGSNSTYADIHTQSTRTSQVACGSSGGMDDRFDLILCSDPVLNHLNGASYISGTYKAYGNDGAHYNQSINNGGNSAVSASVANALYAMSDHLPVIMDLKVDRTAVGRDEALTWGTEWKLAGVPADDQVALFATVRESGHYSLHLSDPAGRMLRRFEFYWEAGAQHEEIDLQGLASGLYILTLSNETGVREAKKLIKR